MDWLPLIIAAVIGIIIGVIATMIPYRRRVDEYAYRVRDLESKNKNTDRDLTDTRGQVQALTANTRAIETTLNETNAKLADTQTVLTDAQSKLAETEAQLQGVNEAKAQLDADLQARVAELTALQGQHEEVSAKLSAVSGELEGAQASIATFKANEEATAQALTAKDAELEGLQKSLAETAGAKDTLETKLKNTRSDVAAELAVLTSTMIKLKEEQLGEAESKLHELTRQLAALKDGQPASE